MMGTSDAFSLPKILKDPERSWDVNPVCDQWLRGPPGAVGGWGVWGRGRVGAGRGRGGAGEWINVRPITAVSSSNTYCPNFVRKVSYMTTLY